MQQYVYAGFGTKRPFGVEIEVNRSLSQTKLAEIVKTVVGTDNAAIHAYGHSCNNSIWVIKTDSSCGDKGNKYDDGGGYEIASGVGSGSKHLKRIADVVYLLKESGARINKFCGLHCHVSIDDFSIEEAAVLMAYWFKIEPLITHALPDHRIDNPQCKLWTKNATRHKLLSSIKSPTDFYEAIRLRNFQNEAKKTSITLINYHRTKSHSDGWLSFNRPTVELRIPEGSLDDFDVKNWSRLFINFVDSCKGKTLPKNLDPADLNESLEILGLSRRGVFAVLSPGLYETKLWFLYRLRKFARNNTVYQATRESFAEMSSPEIKWTFAFPQVTDSEMTIKNKPRQIMTKTKKSKSAKSQVVNDDPYYKTIPLSWSSYNHND